VTSLPVPLFAAVFLVLSASCGDSPGSPPIVGQPPTDRPALAQTYRASGHTAAGDVFVHLFEWKWRDIATECEQNLGPAGFCRRPGLAAARAQHHAKLRLE
jgi:alpha-amylase